MKINIAVPIALAGGALAVPFLWVVNSQQASIRDLRHKLEEIRVGASERPSRSERDPGVLVLRSIAPETPPVAVPRALPPDGGNVAAAASRPGAPPTDLRDRLEESFVADGLDGRAEEVRRDAEEKLKATLLEGSTLRSVECRSSMCRIETSHADPAHYDAFIRRAFLNPDTQIWNAPGFSAPASDGPSADGVVAVVTYLARQGQQLPTNDLPAAP